MQGQEGPSRSERQRIAYERDCLSRAPAGLGGHGNFLTTRERTVLAASLAADPLPRTSIFWGGYPDASRRIAWMSPDYLEAEEWQRSVCQDRPSPYDPLVYLRVTVEAPAASLSHGDYLGSLLGLGLDRDRTGDILCWDDAEGETGADVILLPEAAKIALSHWTHAGAHRLRVTRLAGSPDLRLPETPHTLLTVTVPQLRLDALVSAIYHLSRQRAADVIRGEAVQVNGVPETDGARRLAIGDRIVYGAHGRAVLDAVEGRSRKDRLIVRIRWYH